MKLRAYIHFGVGDTWESREFLRDWMALLGVTECEVACRFPGVYEDMPEVHPIAFGPEMDMRKGWFRKDGVFYLNLWIGCRNGETRPRGDYVIHPGVGCTVENLHRMHRDYAREAGFTPLDRPIVEYIPNVDYSRIDTKSVSKFITSYPANTTFVLVCNGPTGSGHAVNFDMARMVAHIEPRDETVFIFTEKPTVEMDDWRTTDEITGRLTGECDVLKISYLSRFCEVIFGRCSGAQMVCETQENWTTPGMTLLSFTQHEAGATFVRNPQELGLKMRRVWSPANTPEAAAEVLRSVL